ncbi:MAG: hypothetical protein K6F51_11005 [Acetatifactor sp.]|nr:hypothetical protein [Acetatifactor sp.]
MAGKGNYKKNEFHVLSCAIITGLLSELIIALGMVSSAGIFTAIQAICMLLSLVVFVVYGVKIIALKEWDRGFWLAGIFHFLRIITFFIFFLLGQVIGQGPCIVLIGIMPVLSDLCFGIGMESVAQDESRGLKWVWTLWKFAGVIVGIGVIYVSCVYGMRILSERFFEQVLFRHQEDMKFIAYAFLTYWVFRIIQGILTSITAKVMEE